MSALIQQFKRDMESFEEKFKFRSSAIDDPAIEYIATPNIIQNIIPLKRYFITTTLNLTNKMIEELQRRKKVFQFDTGTKEFEKLSGFQKSQAFESNRWINAYNQAIHDTISQLQEFKEFLLNNLNEK